MADKYREPNVLALPVEDEDLAVGRSSTTDKAFDCTIGCIEDIVMEEEFQKIQTDFMDKYYTEFEDTEENKLCYTDIHNKYIDLIEKYLNDQLVSRIPGFSMENFQKELIKRRKELDGEIFDMLLTFSDFLAFKEMFLDYKADKEGNSIDLSSGFTVTSLSIKDSGMGSEEEAMMITPRQDENGLESPRGEPMVESPRN